MIGKNVVRLLKLFDINIAAYDPFFSKTDAEKIGINLVSLEELFKISDVVSLHSPKLKETEEMINGELFQMMKNGSTFINTARGAIIHNGKYCSYTSYCVPWMENVPEWVIIW